MSIVLLRFPHLAKQIFQKLDKEGLAKSRKVERFWQKYIDERNYLWHLIVNIPTVLANGNTYLHLAAEHGQIDVFEMIINEDNNKDPINDLAQTPYLIACGKGRVNIASMLMKKSLELNIDLNQSDNGGRTALHLACQEGCSGIAEMIVNKSSELKMDLNTKDTGGRTAFHLVCSRGHSEIAEIIINNSSKLKINLSTTTNSIVGTFVYQRTAFHLACYGGHIKIVKMILENSSRLNFDLNRRDHSGYTAFQLVCLQGYLKIAEMMINQSLPMKIDLNTKCNHGMTVFHLACVGLPSDDRTRIVEIILQQSEYHRIDLTAVDDIGQSGYQIAQFYNNTEVINLIKSKVPTLVTNVTSQMSCLLSLWKKNSTMR